MPENYRIVQREAQQYVAIPTRVRFESIPTAATHLPKVFAYLASRNLNPSGVPFFRYRSIRMGSFLTIDVGVPTASEVQFDGDTEIIADILPAGQYVETTHVGDPRELVHVTRRMRDWAKESRLDWDVQVSSDGDAKEEIWACRVEWYETEPSEEPDKSKWQTRLSFRLAD